ncbi:uncharacterized protein V1516DRAFT_666224 [Lipomyces oligophaga]|uniref:uncharacterized protein n=1 Tax=Lipomyces oligophaga TaxID=45792 RepID=UPI0034CE0778
MSADGRLQEDENRPLQARISRGSDEPEDGDHASDAFASTSTSPSTSCTPPPPPIPVALPRSPTTSSGPKIPRINTGVVFKQSQHSNASMMGVNTASNVALPPHHLPFPTSPAMASPLSLPPSYHQRSLRMPSVTNVSRNFSPPPSSNHGSSYYHPPPPRAPSAGAGRTFSSSSSTTSMSNSSASARSSYSSISSMSALSPATSMSQQLPEIHTQRQHERDLFPAPTQFDKSIPILPDPSPLADPSIFFFSTSSIPSHQPYRASSPPSTTNISTVHRSSSAHSQHLPHFSTYHHYHNNSNVHGHSHSLDSSEQVPDLLSANHRRFRSRPRSTAEVRSSSVELRARSMGPRRSVPVELLSSSTSAPIDPSTTISSSLATMGTDSSPQKSLRDFALSAISPPGATSPAESEVGVSSVSVAESGADFEITGNIYESGRENRAEIGGNTVDSNSNLILSTTIHPVHVQFREDMLVGSDDGCIDDDVDNESSANAAIPADFVYDTTDYDADEEDDGSSGDEYATNLRESGQHLSRKQIVVPTHPSSTGNELVSDERDKVDGMHEDKAHFRATKSPRTLDDLFPSLAISSEIASKPCSPRPLFPETLPSDTTLTNSHAFNLDLDLLQSLDSSSLPKTTSSSPITAPASILSLDLVREESTYSFDDDSNIAREDLK